MFAEGLARLESQILNLFDPRLFKQYPLSHLKSQSCAEDLLAEAWKYGLLGQAGEVSDASRSQPLTDYLQCPSQGRDSGC